MSQYYQQQRKRPYIMAIEGNIGAGKTTLFNNLKTYIEEKYPNKKIIFMREPVDIWQNICDSYGDSILSKFYKEPDKYAFPFQIMAFSTRLSLLRNTIKENPDCELIVCERSLEADKNIFAKMLFMEGKIEDVNYQIYHHLYNSSAPEFCVDAIIYVDADPDICYQRIHLRNRQGEDKIELDYLRKCRNYYHDWLIYGQNSGGKTNCIHFDDISGNMHIYGKKYNTNVNANEENIDIERENIINMVFENILLERENIPRVLVINANHNANYGEKEEDIGNKWVLHAYEFMKNLHLVERN